MYESELLTPAQAARLLGLKEQTLAVWRSAHRYGLAYHKIGRRVMYRRADLDNWLATRRVTHTEAVLV